MHNNGGKTVLHVITGLSLGGAEMTLYNLLRTTDRSRFSPQVVSLTDRGVFAERIEELDVSVHSLKMRRGRPTPLGLRRLIRVVRSKRPALIQGWMYHANVSAVLAAQLGRVRSNVVWSIRHSVHDLRVEKKSTAAVIRLGARLSRWPAAIVYNARSSAKQHEALGYEAERRWVIPNGFDCERFKPSTSARSELRRDLGLGPDTFLIGMVGRFHPMKDHRTFLQAAARFMRHGRDAHYVLVGPGVCAENGALRREIAGLGLGDRVRLLGPRTEIPRVTAALDVASLSSAWGEGFPNVIGEAMACAVPCVVTDVGDSGWLVGSTGEVVPPRDPEAMAVAWERLYTLGPDGRRSLGALAQRRMLGSFSLERMTAEYQALYEGLLS